MKAVTYEKYGAPSVLHISDVPKLTPNAGEVLIKVHATTVTAGDWRLRQPNPFLARLFNGLLRPKKVNILGFDVAGVVEAVGEGVTQFKPGDEVYAWNGFTFGGYAEYKVLPEKAEKLDQGMIAIKPANMSFEEAAAVPTGALTAQAFLRDMNLQAGQDVLIYGASGSVGTYAVQLAKYHGATVTGVCSTSNLEMVQSLGSDHVVDYTREDVTQLEQRFDIILDAVGYLPKGKAGSLLTPDGKYDSIRGNPTLQQDDLDSLRQIIEAGHLKTVIDRCISMEEIPEAHAYVQKGHKKGNVVVKVR
jgi:NADPH:quinone reductase-like Zn-dependent oxidoreductase